MYTAASTVPFSESAVLDMQQKLAPHFHFVDVLFFRSIFHQLVPFRALGSHISKFTFFFTSNLWSYSLDCETHYETIQCQIHEFQEKKIHVLCKTVCLKEVSSMVLRKNLFCPPIENKDTYFSAECSNLFASPQTVLSDGLYISCTQSLIASKHSSLVA